MSLLSINALTKRYGDVAALTDFSLEVDSGEIMALVGPDGAGKTTMIRILCNLIDPDNGDVHMEGENLRAEFDRFKSRLGYMPQQFSLYPDLSVDENLVFYAGLYDITGEAYRRKRDYLYSFSNLEPFAARRAQALSGGMKQKLALSCALIHEPDLLILDEPTTGVDPLSRRQFWEILQQLRHNGVTILVSTPYMDEVARADRACFIFDGSRLSVGTPKELAAEFQGKIFFADVTPSVQLVDRLSQIDGLAARRFGAGLHLYLEAGDDVSRYHDGLSRAGIDPSMVKPIPPDLEDRFIQLMELKS